MATTATCTIALEAGHRKTWRPEEYVAYLVNQPDGDEPALNYDVDTAAPLGNPGQALPSLLNAFTGLLESPPTAIALSEASSSDPIAEESITATQGTTTQTIYHSKRGCMVTRWATNLASRGINQEWMIRGWHEGLGLSFNPNIRWQENIFRANVNMHNPTTGGTILQPWPENDDPNDLLVSRLLHHSNASGAAGTAYAESACVPLQWDSEGETEAPYTNHGGALHRAILWWRYKFYQRVDPNFGGREFVHRFTSWAFFPRSMDEADFGGDVGQGGSVARFLVTSGFPIGLWNIFDEANWFDIAAGELTPIAGWDTLPNPGAGGWEGYKTVTRYQRAVARADEPSYISSGYGAAILTRSLDGFTVAIAAKVSGTPVTTGKISRYTRPCYINVTRAFHGIVPTTPDIGGKDTATLGIDAASFLGANAGWHGLVCYLFVGHEDDVQSALTELYTSGLLDANPDASLVPQSVAVGTEFHVATMQNGSALCTLEFSGTATADATSGGPGPVEVVTFVVEDGTGLADAESYATVSYADSYALRHGNPSSWVESDEATKQLYLRLATERDIDGVYGAFWSGYRATETQALDWPRVSAGDRSTNQPIDDDVVPERLRKACAYFALLRAEGAVGSLLPEDAGDGGVTQSTDRAAGGFEESRTYSGHRSTQARYRYGESLLEPLLLDDDRVDRA